MKTSRHHNRFYHPAPSAPSFIIPLLFLGLLLLVESPVPQTRSSLSLQKEISDQVLRFHIRANSDTRADQQKKLRVKQSMLEWLAPILEESDTKTDTIDTIQKYLPELTRKASRLAAPFPVTVTLRKEWFPEKTYGTCTLPEGSYQALRIDIGKARGHNWWCVLYPKLCFQDALDPVMSQEGEEKLQQVLDEDAYDLLLHPQKLKIRFRLEFFLRNR